MGNELSKSHWPYRLGRGKFIWIHEPEYLPLLDITFLRGPYKLNFRAPLPLILFSEPGRFNPLKNYVKGERQKRGDFNEKYRSVLPRIGLVEVIRESK